MEKDWKERFWDKVDKSQGKMACWYWTGGFSSHGYGTFWVSTKDKIQKSSHVIAWSLTKGGGYFPEGKFVIMHDCDNKRCCNPGHLTIGTHAQNAQDAKRKRTLVE